MPTGSSDLAAAVGAQIRARRGQRGMSAAELARRSGVSKATLSSLESGGANPTIDTLDAVAVALGIPLSDLLVRGEDTGPQLIRGTPGTEGEIDRELLRRVTGGHQVEIWRLRMPPATEFEGVPHAPGTVEHLVVASGSLRAGPTDDLTVLSMGDLLAFAGDASHTYRTDHEPADVTVLIASPMIG
ncbi:helix-turn-helix domain-containing protein [Flexivirga meconopsidis]|uniref:helix-turn-helix domain-containing protein n=1 Tax=Flexivirga meconopsidis TaxID=2977121 RepID=UPI002240CFB1|nr:XRE family transcriptional regulator [Flexivirga meconopsidis]